MEALRKSAAAVFLMLMLMTGYGTDSAEAGSSGVMPPVRAYELLKQGSGFWLVDVRSPAEFGGCHIEGSMNLPLEELPHRAIPSGKLVVVVDDSLGGLRAFQAVSLLRDKGVENVFVLDGGLYAWAGAGCPLAGENAAGRRYMPSKITADELREAQARGVDMELYDLCGDRELSEKVFPGANYIEGTDLDARLEKLAAMLSAHVGRSMPDELEKKPCIVLALPPGVDAGRVMQVSRLDVGDVSYLPGGYGAVTATPGRMTVKNTDGCSTCP